MFFKKKNKYYNFSDKISILYQYSCNPTITEKNLENLEDEFKKKWKDIKLKRSNFEDIKSSENNIFFLKKDNLKLKKIVFENLVNYFNELENKNEIFLKKEEIVIKIKKFVKRLKDKDFLTQKIKNFLSK